jgi:DNA-binding SARP family transcriptional activator
MEFRVLGPVGAWSADREIRLNGSKERTVLAALLLAKGRVLSDAQLGEALWGSSRPGTYQAQIYTYASRMRQRLGVVADIVRKGSGYHLRLGAARCDLDVFRELTRAGTAALEREQHGLAADTLHEALSLWRGPTLADVTEHLAAAEAPAIEESRLQALEGRIAADLALRRHDALIAELMGLVNTHPLRERLRAQLVLALYESERQADAIAAYHEGRRRLEDELGVVPGPTLRAAYRTIVTGELSRTFSGLQA